jgi:hypothetical protein
MLDMKEIVMKSWTLLFIAALTSTFTTTDARTQVRVLPWLDHDVWHVVEGGGPSNAKFSIVNENDYAVTVTSEQTYSGPTHGDITDSVFIDGITQSALGVTIRAHNFTIAAIEFTPFGFPDPGPLNDGWVDLTYAITTSHGWGANNDIRVYVSDTPEPSSLLLLGTGIAGFAGVIRRKLS